MSTPHIFGPRPEALELLFDYSVTTVSLTAITSSN